MSDYVRGDYVFVRLAQRVKQLARVEGVGTYGDLNAVVVRKFRPNSSLWTPPQVVPRYDIIKKVERADLPPLTIKRLEGM